MSIDRTNDFELPPPEKIGAISGETYEGATSDIQDDEMDLAITTRGKFFYFLRYVCSIYVDKCTGAVEMIVEPNSRATDEEPIPDRENDDIGPAITTRGKNITFIFA